MDIKGTAFLSRKEFIVSTFGAPRWESFLQELIARDPFFKRALLATTPIHEKSFLLFVDHVVATFYGNDPHAHWELGEKAAEWALTVGPVKAFLKSQKTSEFAKTAPVLWTTYYNEGSANTTVDGNSIIITVQGVTTPHVYYEYSTLGYFKRGLELTGASVIMHCIKGFSKGDREIVYKAVLSQQPQAVK